MAKRKNQGSEAKVSKAAPKPKPLPQSLATFITGVLQQFNYNAAAESFAAQAKEQEGEEVAWAEIPENIRKNFEELQASLRAPAEADGSSESDAAESSSSSEEGEDTGESDSEDEEGADTPASKKSESPAAAGESESESDAEETSSSSESAASADSDSSSASEKSESSSESSSSSDESSDSSSSSSESEASDSSSSSSSSSESESSSSSSDDSSSDESSDSESEASSESSSESSSSSESDSESDKKYKKMQKQKKSEKTSPARVVDNKLVTAARNGSISESSATLADSDSSFKKTVKAQQAIAAVGAGDKRKFEEDEEPEDEAEAVQQSDAKRAKKEIIPFSRIPKDIKVDERFASNKYVSYDYADRAHRDLIVTKGKGFTKEKNKKKRGAYKGGKIDTVGVKGIKFDD